MNELPGYVAEDDPVRKAMQFASANPALQEAIAVTPGELSTPEDVTWADTMYDAWANSFVGSALGIDSPNVKWYENGRDLDDGYDAVNDPDLTDPTKPYSYFMNDFLGTTNSDYARRLKLDIDKEVKSQKMWAQSSWPQYLAGGAVTIGADPTTYIPFGVMSKFGLALSKTGIAFKAGAAIEGAAFTGASVATSELMRQLTDPTRKWQDSASAIAIGSALGAALGAYFSKASVNTANSILKAATDDVKAWSVNPAVEAQGIIKQARDLGAAIVEPEMGGTDTLIAGAKTRSVMRATQAVRLTPGLRTLTSEVEEVRKLAWELSEQSAVMEANLQGRTLGMPVESMLRNWTAEAASVTEDLRHIFAEMRRAGHKINEDDFNRATYNALTDPNFRGVSNTIVGSPEYYVARAAEKAKRYVDWAASEAKSANYVSKLDNAEAALFPRKYLTDVIEARRNDFLELVADAISKTVDPKDFVSKADMEDAISSAAWATYEKLVYKNTESVPLPIRGIKISSSLGPLKGKELLLPDNYSIVLNGKTISLSEFVDNNISSAITHHAHRFGSEVELVRKYGRADMRDQIDSIRKAYSNKIAEAGNNMKEVARIRAMEDADIRDIVAQRDIIRRQYNSSSYNSRLGQAGTNINKVLPTLYMGNMLLNAIPDVAKVVTQKSLGHFMTKGMPAASQILWRNIKENILRSPKTQRQAVRMGAAIEHIMNNRAAHIAGILDEATVMPRKGLDDKIDLLNRSFFKWTGITGWNNFWKEVASNTALDTVITNSVEKATKGKIRNGYDRAFMARLGFTDDTMKQIAKATEDGVFTIKGGLWSIDFDKMAQYPGLINKLRPALGAEADRIVLTPGAADLPLVFRMHPLMKTILAFKTFAVAGVTKTMLSGIQGPTKTLIQLLAFGHALSMVSVTLKKLAAGDWEDTEKYYTTQRGFAELNGLALDENIFLPVVPLVLDTIERTTGLPITPGTVLPEMAGGRVSQRVSKNPYIQSPSSTFFGPATAYIDDFMKNMGTLHDMAQGEEPTEREARKLYRMFPYTSLPYVKLPLESQINEQMQ